MRDSEARERQKERSRNTRAFYKEAVWSKIESMFGSRSCVNCGEDYPQFLSIDHVYNDGHLDRGTRDIGSATNYRRILAELENGLDNKKYQPLCHNCNFGKALNKGVLPDIRAWRAAKNNQSHVAAGDNSNFNKEL